MGIVASTSGQYRIDHPTIGDVIRTMRLPAGDLGPRDRAPRPCSLVSPDMQHDPTTKPGIVEMSERVQSDMAHTDAQSSRPPTSSGEITVYWRPGCPFCSSLRSGLRRAGVTVREVNIWEDPAAAAFVRSVARGNETVPTVSVGSVNLVNPSAKKVLSVAATEAPGLLPAPPTTQRREHRRRLFSRRETTS